jgi:hypothetical protein
MTEKLNPRYADRDFPVLREIVRLMDESIEGGVRSSQVEAALPALQAEDIQRAAANLARAGLIDIRGASGVPFLHATNVSERALRMTGLWPDEQAAGDALLWVLEQKVADSSTTEERTRWEKIRDSFGSAGRDFAVDLAAALAARTMSA